MKNIALFLFAAVLGFSACKKKGTDEPSDLSAPLEERLPGYWEVKEVQYSGFIPNGSNPSQGFPFAGEGEQVSGFFNFDSDTNTGEFDISFVAKIDLGLGTPIALTVAETQSGLWKANDTTQIVTMWSGDTITNWDVLTNQKNMQKWQASLVFDFGSPYDSIPVDVQAIMRR